MWTRFSISDWSCEAHYLSKKAPPKITWTVNRQPPLHASSTGRLWQMGIKSFEIIWNGRLFHWQFVTGNRHHPRKLQREIVFYPPTTRSRSRHISLRWFHWDEFIRIRGTPLPQLRRHTARFTVTRTFSLHIPKKKIYVTIENGWRRSSRVWSSRVFESNPYLPIYKAFKMNLGSS